MSLRPLTPFDRLGLGDGGLIMAVRQMDGLTAGIKHRQAKEDELREIQRKREREQNERQVKAKP